MTVVQLVVLALATWRVSNMLADTEQTGPFGLLDKIRYRAGVRFGPDGLAYGTNGLSKGLLCIYCNSVWIGIGLAVIFYFYPILAFYMALPFTLSAAAIWAEGEKEKWLKSFR
jgi:hypothetical protein